MQKSMLWFCRVGWVHPWHSHSAEHRPQSLVCTAQSSNQFLWCSSEFTYVTRADNTGSASAIYWVTFTLLTQLPCVCYQEAYTHINAVSHARYKQIERGSHLICKLLLSTFEINTTFAISGWLLHILAHSHMLYLFPPVLCSNCKLWAV